MKYSGCIMEIRKNSIMVMTTDCLFLEVKKRDGVFVGMQMQFQSQDIVTRSNKKLIQYISVAAILLLLVVTQLFVIGPWDISNQPVAVLTIDINPSIQLEIDEEEKVISAEALNSEAQEFPLTELIDRPAKDAMQQIMEVAEAKGYINKLEENYVLVTSVPLLKDEVKSQRLDVLVQELKESIETKASVDNQVVVLTMKSDQETLKKAREEKLSVGKAEVIKQLKANDSMNIEDIQKLNVNELVKEVSGKEISIPGWRIRDEKRDSIDDDDEDDKEDDEDDRDDKDDRDEKDDRDDKDGRDEKDDRDNKDGRDDKDNRDDKNDRDDKDSRDDNDDRDDKDGRDDKNDRDDKDSRDDEDGRDDKDSRDDEDGRDDEDDRDDKDNDEEDDNDIEDKGNDKPEKDIKGQNSQKGRGQDNQQENQDKANKEEKDEDAGDDNVAGDTGVSEDNDTDEDSDTDENKDSDTEKGTNDDNITEEDNDDKDDDNDDKDDDNDDHPSNNGKNRS